MTWRVSQLMPPMVHLLFAMQTIRAPISSSCIFYRLIRQKNNYLDGLPVAGKLRESCEMKRGRPRLRTPPCYNAKCGGRGPSHPHPSPFGIRTLKPQTGWSVPTVQSSILGLGMPGGNRFPRPTAGVPTAHRFGSRGTVLDPRASECPVGAGSHGQPRR